MRRAVPALLSFSLVAAAGCAGSPEPDSATGDDTSIPAPPGTFRVAFISDTHVIGPAYTEPRESEGIDNDSIMKTPERLRGVVARLNAIEPPPEMVFILGDVVHDDLIYDDLSVYRDDETGYSRVRDILAELEMPVHLVWGNHDYEVKCGGGGFDQAFAHQVFAEVLDEVPYQSIDHKGWRFVLANSQLGPTWTPGDPLCDTGLASYGRAQLDWIDEQLSAGMPTIAMAHYMMLVTENDEDPGHALPGLRSVLEKHDNMELFVVGHTHRWIDMRETETFPHMVLGATRYDEDNFILFDLEEFGDAYVIPDFDKPRWYTPCANTWTYDGEPAADPSDPTETGDCDGQ